MGKEIHILESSIQVQEKLCSLVISAAINAQQNNRDFSIGLSGNFKYVYNLITYCFFLILLIILFFKPCSILYYRWKSYQFSYTWPSYCIEI